jgi:hypothetical protein
MNDEVKGIRETVEASEAAEPLLEWPDADGGFYRLYTGVALQPGEGGEVRVLKSRSTPQPGQIVLQESFKDFLRNGGEEWLKSQYK